MPINWSGSCGSGSISGSSWIISTFPSGSGLTGSIPCSGSWQTGQWALIQSGNCPQLMIFATASGGPTWQTVWTGSGCP